MRRTALLLVTFIIAIKLAYGQDEFVKVSKYYEFKVETYVKMKDDSNRDLYKTFFTGSDLNSKKTKIAYPASKKKDYTSVGKLKNRVFKISDILESGDQGRREKMLVLEDVANGEKIFYYDFAYGYLYFFSV